MLIKHHMQIAKETVHKTREREPWKKMICNKKLYLFTDCFLSARSGTQHTDGDLPPMTRVSDSKQLSRGASTLVGRHLNDFS